MRLRRGQNAASAAATSPARCRRAGSPCASTRRRRGRARARRAAPRCRALMPEAQRAPAVGPQQLVGHPAAEQGERERDERDADGGELPRPVLEAPRGAAGRASPAPPAPSAYSARSGAGGVEQHHPVQRAEAGEGERTRARARTGTGSVGSLAAARRASGPAVALAAVIRRRPPSRRRRRCGWSRKPWQPATSSTGRRLGSAPGITRMQPPGVRPSPRGGRSSGRAATSTTRPRRFWAATSDGPVDSSSSASRTWAAGHASRSFSITCARRSPGSSSEQPLRRAKCTVSEAAARTAPSSASWEAGARGSSTTSGRESASEISLRSIRPWPRASGRPVDARGGRAGPVLAQAVELGLGRRDQRRAGVGGRGVAAARGGADGQDARQHEDLVGAVHR